MYTKTLSNGTVIEMSYIKDYIPGVPQFRVVIDGDERASAATITRLGKPLDANGVTVVGVLELRKGGEKSGVGLTHADVDALQVEADTNRTPEQRERLRMSELLSQRNTLERRVSGALEDVYPGNLYDSEHEHVNIQRQRAAKAAEADLEAARAALFAFDAEHPEVLAAIKAEEEASVARNRWN